MKHRKLEEWTKARAVAANHIEMAAILKVQPETVRSLLSYYRLPRFARASKNTPEMCEAVIRRYRAGGSLSTVAAEFSFTRNQVAGILHRAGEFKKRGPRIVKPRVAKPRASYTTPRAPKLKSIPFKAAEAAIVPLNIPFSKNTGCKWLYGDDPHDPPACGHSKFGAYPYCESHCAIAYRAPEARVRNARPR